MIIEVTKPNLVYVLFRHRGTIIGSFVALACLSIAYCLVVTPLYQSSTGLVVNFSRLPSDVPGDTQRTSAQTVTPLDREEILNSYILEIKSVELVRDVINKIGLEDLYPPTFGLNPFAYLIDYLQILSALLARKKNAQWKMPWIAS